MPAVGIFTKQERKYLVFGYIKQITCNTPTDIIDLCFVFYDDVYEWVLNTSQLHSFIYDYNAYEQNKNILSGAPFITNEIQFQCMLSKDYSQSQVKFDLYILSIPPPIKSVTYFMQLFCTQFQYEFRSFDVQTCVGKSKGWPSKTVTIANVKTFQQLNLECYLEILAIEYNDITALQVPRNYYKPIVMNVESEYKWNIDNKLLNIFKQADNGRGYYADSFNNDCFCIIVSPNGSGLHTKGQFILGLKLLKLHHKLKSISLNINIEAYTNKKILWNDSKCVSRNTNLVKLWPDKQFVISTESIQLWTTMWIHIFVKIEELETVNGKTVLYKQFEEYDVMNVTKTKFEIGIHNNYKQQNYYPILME
eukprot:181210_1